MFKAHGIGYAEYGRSLEKRLTIEKKRERDHEHSLQVTSDHSRVLHP